MPMAAKAKFGQIGSGSVVRRLVRTRKKKRRRVGYLLGAAYIKPYRNDQS